MSRQKHRAPPFVMVRRDLLKDPEWRKLSSSAKLIYIYLRAKFNYKTYSEVTLAYSEMKDMMSSKTVSRAFQELRDKGFIEKIKQGGLFGGVCAYKFIGQFKDFYYKGYPI
jgi:DNA-binding transcriptional ArsR family regulator